MQRSLIAKFCRKNHKMVVITPPHPIVIKSKSIFLAGSIEQGKAVDWQNRIIEKLSPFPFTILNPRRPDWDSSWEQKIENPQFYEQVNWELNALEKADMIILYFDPKSKSPISLLEFGLFARTGKMMVCCPEGFWRKGNVDIVCERFNIPQKSNLYEIIKELLK
jgi:hypothetical protein